MRFVSLFSGVGGFDLGLEAAGHTCVAQVEWDKDCRAVLARHWPAVPRWADVCDVDGAHLPPAELVAFGSPCQDLSVAGNRAGFVDGGRSNLFHEAIRIIDEMRAASDKKYPAFVVWENVVGALSSNDGRDFATVLDALANSGALDICWRVLNAQHFGVPQRRRRIFVVADLAGERAGQILAEPSGLRRDSDSGGTSGQDATDRPGTGATGGCVTALTTRCGNAQDDAQVPQLFVNALDTQRGGADDNDAQAGRLIIDGGVPELGWEPGRVPNRTGRTPGDRAMTAMIGPTVRRLTPVECERLMGWPDDHTRWRADGTEVSDSVRYRMCGNGVASVVAHYIGQQLAEVVGCPSP